MNETREAEVEIWLARCPMCRGSDLQHKGTRVNAKGQTVRYYQCRDLNCNTKFRGRVMNADGQGEEASETPAA